MIAHTKKLIEILLSSVVSFGSNHRKVKNLKTNFAALAQEWLGKSVRTFETMSAMTCDAYSLRSKA